jgi:hypothetical protein
MGTFFAVQPLEAASENLIGDLVMADYKQVLQAAPHTAMSALFIDSLSAGCSVRTSRNAVTAKFAESPFHEFG